MPKNKKLAFKLKIQTYQILANYDEVCNPSLSSILLALKKCKNDLSEKPNHFFHEHRPLTPEIQIVNNRPNSSCFSTFC